MRRFLATCFTALLAFACAGASGCASSRNYDASASVSYSSDSYYDDEYAYLDRYGTWVDIEGYGDAWCPLEVSAGWRPYTVGSWAYTDYGWMWISQDPWGSVPYHYGRWAYDSYYGWVWVPGDVWAPAWVSWRYGDGWCGWAPLPPDVDWRAGIGFSVEITALDSRIDSYGWTFVPARYLTSSNLRTYMAPPSRNVTFISITQNVTNYTEINSRPAERGLRPEMIERDIGRKIAPRRIVESDRMRNRRGAEIRGETIEVRRPVDRVGSRAKERARAQAPERVMPPRQLIRHQEVERQNFEQRMQRERSELENEHRREMREPPRGISREELTRRQETELRAQKEREDRERRVIEERTKRLKERPEGRGNRGRGRGNQGQGQGRGQDRDRGEGNN